MAIHKTRNTFLLYGGHRPGPFKIAVEAAGLDTSKPVVSGEFSSDVLTAHMAALLDLKHFKAMPDVDCATMFRRAIEGNRVRVLANIFIDESKEPPQRSSCAILLITLHDARRSLLKDGHFLKDLKKVLGENYGPDYYQSLSSQWSWTLPRKS